MARMLFTRPRIAGRRIPAAFCVAAAMPFAYDVRESPVSAVETTSSSPPIAANERAAKIWEVTGGSAALNRVELRVPGLVYVTADEVASKSTDTIASVRVSGDSKELVECVEVVPLPPNGVQLRFKSKECADLRGHLLTSLNLAKQGHVNEFKACGGGTVVVEDGVLLADCEHASVHVRSEGSGDVFVTSKRHAINLKELRLSILGTGSFQFLGPETVKVRDQFLLDIAGFGKMTAFVGNVNASLLKTSIAGPGESTLVSSNTYVVDKLKTSITGSGKATYIGGGQCRIQRCSVTGSGTVIARDIRCEDASISCLGEGDVTWQVANKITVSGWGSKTIRYVDELPKVIDGKSVTLRPATPQPSGTNAVDVKPVEAPTRAAAFSDIRAIYKPSGSAFENTTSLGAIRHLLVSVLGTDDNEVKIEAKIEKDK